jgi:hypothetical protein
MAGLLDIFGTSGSDTLGLLGMSPADIQKNRDDAQAQALYALAGRLFQGGNTGASIAQGLQQGQQAYKGAMQSNVQDILQNTQLSDMLKKRQQEQQLLEQQQQAQQILSKAYKPQVFPETPLTNIDGQEIAGPNQPQAAGKGLSSAMNQLIGLGPAGWQALQTASGIEKAMRPETLTLKKGESLLQRSPEGKFEPVKVEGLPSMQKGDNPFEPLITGGAVHASVLPYAKQLSQGFSRMDAEDTDKSLKSLIEMNNLATQRDLTREDSQANKALTAQLVALRIDEAKRQADSAKDGKPLPTNILTDLAKRSDNVVQLASMKDTFKPEYGGYVTDAAGRLAITVALKSSDPKSKELGQWWQNYDLYANQVRNDLFGAALSKQEAAMFDRATVTAGMSGSQIQENLKRQQEIAQRGYDRLSNAMRTQGYSKSGLDALKPVLMPSLDSFNK